MAIPVSPDEYLKRQQKAVTQTNLPMMSPTNLGQPLPLSPNAVQTTPQAQEAQETLSTAQQTAQKPVGQQLSGAIQESALKAVQQPLGGFDPMRFAEQQTAQFAEQRQKQAEAFRRATGSAAGAGSRQSELFGRMLQGTQDVARFGQQAKAQAAQQQQQSQIAGLQAGSDALKTLQGQQSQQVSDMVNAAGGAAQFAQIAAQQNMQLNEQQFEQWKTINQNEQQQFLQNRDIESSKANLATQLQFEERQAQLGREFTGEQNSLNRSLQSSLAHLDIKSQKELMNIKAQIDNDQLVREQDFISAQNELNRLQEQAINEGNIKAQQELQVAQNEFASLMEQQKQRWNSAERVATESFQRGMTISNQQFQEGMKYLDHRLNEAMTEKNFVHQKKLQQDQFNFEFQKNTQNFNNQQKLQVLDSQLKEATANNDVERQKQIMMAQHQLNVQQMQVAHGHDKMLAWTNKSIQEALNNQNFDHAIQMENHKFLNQKKLQDAELNLQKMQIDLQQQGIDMQQVEQQYNMIQNGIQSHLLDPNAGLQMLQQAYKGTGIELKAPDVHTSEKAIMKEFENMQLQYALSSGIDKVQFLNTDGTFKGLPTELKSGFHSYMMENVYDQQGYIKPTLTTPKKVPIEENNNNFTKPVQPLPDIGTGGDTKPDINIENPLEGLIDV